MAVPPTAPLQVRVARPTRRFAEVVAFYRDAVGLPVLGTFADHDGFDGVILGLPDASRQLELVHTADAEPRPTSEDQLVLYCGPAAPALVARIRAAGHEPQVPANPYWTRTGAAGFVDPDGYWLVVSAEGEPAP